MTPLEDRLRTDLRLLADALLDAADLAGDVALVDPADGGGRPVVVDPTAATPAGPAPMEEVPVAAPAGSAAPVVELTDRVATGAGRRRVVALAAAVAVVAGGAVAVERAGWLDDRTVIGAASPLPSDRGTWTAMAEGPLAPRPHAVTGWTGSELVVWAGSNLARNFAYSDGASYDPATDTWSPLQSPGWGHPGLSASVLDGRIYALAKGGGVEIDPEAGTWTDLPEVDGLYLARTVATDDALWGLGVSDLNPVGQPDLALIRYEPEGDRWIPGPTLPGDDARAPLTNGLPLLDTTAVWTGSEILVWQGDTDGAAFDPDTGTWRTVERPHWGSDAFGMAPLAVTDVGSAVIVPRSTDAGTGTGLADVAVLGDRGWTWLDIGIPVDDPTTVTTAGAGEWLLVLAPGADPVVVHLPTGWWYVDEDSPLAGPEAPNTAWTGEELLVWGGAGLGGDDVAGARWRPPSG